ncbi:MAG: tRNA (guanosine(37)-N1)-methyltransferase TrmD [Bradymonadia bacterium]
MKTTVVTIFPEMFPGYLGESVIGRALKQGLATIECVDPRAFTTDRHRSVDDVPFGGGAGMVMKPEPLAKAIESVGPVSRRVLLAPAGRTFTQADAWAWSRLDHLVLVCGRYEGVDERVRDTLIDDVVSIGDYVLTGGEVAAMVILDATIRQIPGVLGNADSLATESHGGDGLLEHPHYTRPSTWRGQPVPEVLLSGHHARIDQWRRLASVERTARWRPELLDHVELTPEEQQRVEEINETRNAEASTDIETKEGTP